MPPKAKAPTKAKAKAPAKKEGVSKERAPRRDYGFSPDAKIRLTDKENKFRGQTLEWYERLKKANGKKVETFLANNQDVTNKKGKAEPPRGWLRHFVVNGYAELEQAA